MKERKLKTGRRSLYLEYYETGFRKKENLELYLMPDDVRGAKSHNKKVMEQAMKIRSERILTPPNFEKQRVEKEEKRATRERLSTLTWIDWCQEFVDFAIESGFVKKNIDMKKGVKDKVTKYLKRKKKTDMLLVKVTKDDIIGLYDYMRNGYRCPKKERNTKDKSGKLGDFTLMLFGQAIAAMFNKAVRDGLIEISPVELVEKKHKFGVPDTPREALTVEELKRFLAVVPTSKEQGIAQKAFGFACMTGLRLSDVRTITWSNIKEIGGQLSVTKIQQKTKKFMTKENEVKPINAVIYARVSSTGDRQSTDRQVKDLTDYALYKEYNVVSVYTEHISGAKKNGERPVLCEAIDRCKEYAQPLASEGKRYHITTQNLCFHQVIA